MRAYWDTVRSLFALVFDTSRSLLTLVGLFWHSYMQCARVLGHLLDKLAGTKQTLGEEEAAPLPALEVLGSLLKSPTYVHVIKFNDSRGTNSEDLFKN